MPEKPVLTPAFDIYRKEIAEGMQATMLKGGVSSADINFHINQKSTNGVHKEFAGDTEFSAQEIRAIDELLTENLGRFSTFEAVYGEEMPTSYSIDALKPQLFDALTETIVELCEAGKMRLAPKMTPSKIFKLFLQRLD